MCIFGGATPKAPPLPPPPPVAPTAEDAGVTRSRQDEIARLRAMSGTGSTLLTAGKDLESGMVGGKTMLGQ